MVSRWGEHGPRPAPNAVLNELFAALVLRADIDVACPAVAAWELLTNVERIGEFSPECVAAEWLDSATGPVLGARFAGTNRIVDETGEAFWIRPCTVTACEPPHRFGYVVGDRYDGSPASRWDFTIEAFGDDRCRIRQTFRHVPDGLTGLRHFVEADVENAASIVDRRRVELHSGMETTLRAMKKRLEGGLTA